MKRIIYIITVHILFISFSLSLLIGHAHASDPNKVVAKVGDFEIKEVYLEEVLDRYVPRGGYHPIVEESERKKYAKDALNDIIEIELLYHGAEERGIKIPDEKINRVIKANIKKFGSEENFKKALKRNGLDIKSFRERIKKYSMVRQLLADLMEESKCSDEEARRYYEKHRSSFKRPESVHLFHIHIKVSPTATEKEWKEKKKFAEKILERLKKGESFYDLAYKYSDDQYRVKGGDMGFIHKGRLRPEELDKVAFSLKVGELSDVIQTIYGYHILKVTEKKPPEQLGFDEVKDRIKNKLTKKKYENKKREIIERMRKKYPVQVFIDFNQKVNKKSDSTEN